MKYIELTQGFQAIVDDDDYDLVEKYSWYVIVRKYTSYAARNGPRNEYGQREYIPMHRFILGLTPEDIGIVDHINKNGLDNRRTNLRLTDKSGNAYNSIRAYGYRTCIECEKRFYPKHKTAKFCNSSCFGKWNSKQRIKKHQKTWLG